MMELKKCEVCGEEKKNMFMHMKKHNMHTLNPPTLAGTPTSDIETETSSVELKLDAMIAGLNSVVGAVSKLIELHDNKKNPNANNAVIPNVIQFNAKLEDETYPENYTPPRFRKLCDEILSPDFGLDVLDFPDRTDFQVNISVPEKFSSVSEIDRQKGVKDIRSRMIPRALGENGVKEWCMLVRKNLNKYYQKEGVATPFSSMAQ